MVATYKIEVDKTGNIRRKPGRAKGVRESGPRLLKGARAELQRLAREQAKQTRLAALKRRQVQAALGGESLPGGSSVNDLTPLEASQIALERQGLRAQAESMNQQLQAAREAVQAQRDATTELARLRGDLNKKPSKGPPPPVTPRTPKTPQGVSSPGVSPAASPMTPKDRKKSKRQAAADKKKARQAAAQTRNSPAGVTTRSKAVQGGEGLLSGLRAAMDVAEQGNPQQAEAMIRSLQRSRLDPVNQALQYCRSCKQ